jgi:hypothetical protein
MKTRRWWVAVTVVAVNGEAGAVLLLASRRYQDSECEADAQISAVSCAALDYRRFQGKP